MSIQMSYVHGASNKPLIGLTIGQFFDETCGRYGEREAVVVRHQKVRLTYSELRRRVDALACGLIRLGLNPGDRIGIWSQNNLEWTLTQFATAKAGLILVNINPAYQRAEVEYALNKVGCRALILAPSFKTSDYLEMMAGLAPELAYLKSGRLKASKLPALELVIRLGDEKTAGMLNFSELEEPPTLKELDALQDLGATLQFDSPINIQFTSGTTGRPKGATLSHHGILNNSFFLGETMRFTENDRLSIPVPLYHAFGMVMGNLCCLTHGAAMVYPSEAFDPLATLQAMAEEKCTAVYGVPTMYMAMLDHPDFKKYDLSSLRTGIMSGSPCPIELMKRVVDQMHMNEVTIAYGMTETSPISFQSDAEDTLERRVSTVGRIRPHVEVKIVNSDGHVVPRGEPGEVLTRGYSVMLGYWGDVEKSSEAIDAAGWMHTGDLATIDDQGYCNIVGRLKDMVIRGGENIYPREIEEFLYLNPHIRDVQVIGVPDHKYGEELCAWIILRDGNSSSEEDIRNFCKGQIAHFKIPRYIKFVDSFPMTITGKIRKIEMREITKVELNLTDLDHA